MRRWRDRHGHAIKTATKSSHTFSTFRRRRHLVDILIMATFAGQPSRNSQTVADAVQGDATGETSRQASSLSVHSLHTTSTPGELEAARPPPKDELSSTKEEQQKEAQDPNLVTWDSPDSQENPRDWSHRRRWVVITIVSSYTLLSPLASSMIAPALPLLSRDFHLTSSVQESMMLSIFVLSFAVGPLLYAPLTEMFGRRVVLQTTNLCSLRSTSVAAPVAHRPR